MEKMKFERCWSYYLSIENMFKNTSQYVSHSEKNQYTYSDEFAKIILLSCSEIDALLKMVCEYKNIPSEKKYYDMKDYSKALINIENIKSEAYATTPMTSENESCIVIFPFEEISCVKHGGLKWWEDYQNIKHNRLDNAELGNLFNAASALVAHYIILRIIIDFLDEHSGKEYVKKNNQSDFWIPAV